MFRVVFFMFPSWPNVTLMGVFVCVLVSVLGRRLERVFGAVWAWKAAGIEVRKWQKKYGKKLGF